MYGREIRLLCCIVLRFRVDIILRNSIVKSNPLRITSCLWLYLCFGWAHWNFFVGFENTASCRCSTTCWLSPTLSACLRLSHSGRHVLCASLLGVADCAVLCCAVLWYMLLIDDNILRCRSWVCFCDLSR